MMRFSRSAALAAVFFLVVSLIHAKAYAPFECNRAASAIESRTRAALKVSGGDSRSLAQSNVRELRRRIEDCPHDVELRMLLGANQQILRRWSDAAFTYQELLAISRRPEIYFNLGEVLWRSGDRKRGSEMLILAARSDPSLIDEIADPGARYAVDEALRSPE